MSDEASGPEDETFESKDEWKEHMAEVSGFSKDLPLENMRFWEKIRPEWRSCEVSLL